MGISLYWDDILVPEAMAWGGPGIPGEGQGLLWRHSLGCRARGGSLRGTGRLQGDSPAWVRSAAAG